VDMSKGAMTDLHIRVLRDVARQAQRRLDAHDTVEHAGSAASLNHLREHLDDTASRTRARLTAAEARRRGHPPSRA
jgi:hypothetical protein